MSEKQNQKQIRVTPSDGERELIKILAAGWGLPEAAVVMQGFDRGKAELMFEYEQFQRLKGQPQPQPNQSPTRVDLLTVQRLADQLGIPSDRLLKAIKEIKLEVVNGVHG